MPVITREAFRGALPALTPQQLAKVHITWHWTAGSYASAANDASHYHAVFGEHGEIHRGGSIAANMSGSSSTPGRVSHTRNANSYNIGLSAAAMGDASESAARQGRYGSYPVTQAQVEMMLNSTYDILAKYNLPVDRVLAHEEWDSIKGIRQDRWDVCAICHLDIRPRLNPDGTYESMNYVRRRLAAMLAPAPVEVTFTPQTLEAWRAFVAMYDAAQLASLPVDTLRTIKALREMPPFAAMTRDLLT